MHKSMGKSVCHWDWNPLISFSLSEFYYIYHFYITSHVAFIFCLPFDFSVHLILSKVEAQCSNSRMILRKFPFDFQQLLLCGLHFRAPRFMNAESHNIINLLEWRDV